MKINNEKNSKVIDKLFKVYIKQISAEPITNQQNKNKKLKTEDIKKL